ncbi:hypothetical protein B0H63DRAFT_561668 [Podospora didyma]|uniref:Uncharacterized protein n=1 Tax=Podospora didyma TaxID=330526 RepID=A0AAE0KK49_9PEZI|nr:hypothetical protein B0H63DRAFT_561668 [Podospora didyma]
MATSATTTTTTGTTATTTPLPLTTIWSPPPGCQSILDWSERDANCWPPGDKEIYDGWLYYSPGVCIDGYTIGCTAERGATRDPRVVHPGETAARCVPSGDVHQILAVSWTESRPAGQIRWASSGLSIPALATSLPRKSSSTPSGLSSGAKAGFAVGELPATHPSNVVKMDASQIAVHRIPELPGPPVGNDELLNWGRRDSNSSSADKRLLALEQLDAEAAVIEQRLDQLQGPRQ